MQAAQTESTELIKFDAPELSSIETNKADRIKATFEPMAEMLKEFEASYSEIITESEKEITKDLTAKAKRLRLDIGKVRVKTEKLRKSEKEEYLRAGKAIDGVSNILKWAVTDKENRLKEIEDHFEIMERKRLEALQAERVEALSRYVEDAHERDLSSMDEDVWNAYFAAKKKEYEDRLEAERKAEQERIEAERKEKLRREREDTLRPYYDFYNGSVQLEDISEDEFAALVESLKEKKAAHDAEQERIRKENERLKKEAEKRAKEEAKRKAREEAERKEREEKERKEREAYEAKLKKEAEEKARLEAELKRQEEERKAREEADAKAKAEAEKAARNKAHRAKVNKDVAKKLTSEAGLDEVMSKAVVDAIASGKIPHVEINY